MSVELGPRAERGVTITLKESDAALLSKILRFVYSDGNKAGSEIHNLRADLANLNLSDTLGRSVKIAPGGVRIYDGAVEW